MATEPHDPPQRQEHDSLGAMALPAAARHGIHTARALDNFPLLGRPVHPALARAFGAVKLAALRSNRRLGFFPDPAKADAMERACRELMDGALAPEIVVDALQGGAGTSTNMNVNEVLANRALELLGLAPGNYARVSPLDDLNLHQSTNDTYPTALRVAAILGLRELERAGAGPAGGLPGPGEEPWPTWSRWRAPKARTPCSPPWAGAWAPTPRPSTGTAGAWPRARSGCAW